ncbi:hypothetical protein IWQ60_010767, partial [Tieghemiomyces parasiticus]
LVLRQAITRILHVHTRYDRFQGSSLDTLCDLFVRCLQRLAVAAQYRANFAGHTHVDFFDILDALEQGDTTVGDLETWCHAMNYNPQSRRYAEAVAAKNIYDQHLKDTVPLVKDCDQAADELVLEYRDLIPDELKALAAQEVLRANGYLDRNSTGLDDDLMMPLGSDGEFELSDAEEASDTDSLASRTTLSSKVHAPLYDLFQSGADVVAHGPSLIPAHLPAFPVAALPNQPGLDPAPESPSDDTSLPLETMNEVTIQPDVPALARLRLAPGEDNVFNCPVGATDDPSRETVVEAVGAVPTGTPHHPMTRTSTAPSLAAHHNLLEASRLEDMFGQILGLTGSEAAGSVREIHVPAVDEGALNPPASLFTDAAGDTPLARPVSVGATPCTIHTFLRSLNTRQRTLSSVGLSRKPSAHLPFPSLASPLDTSGAAPSGYGTPTLNTTGYFQQARSPPLSGTVPRRSTLKVVGRTEGSASGAGMATPSRAISIPSSVFKAPRTGSSSLAHSSPPGPTPSTGSTALPPSSSPLHGSLPPLPPSLPRATAAAVAPPVKPPIPFPSPAPPASTSNGRRAPSPIPPHVSPPLPSTSAAPAPRPSSGALSPALPSPATAGPASPSTVAAAGGVPKIKIRFSLKPKTPSAASSPKVPQSTPGGPVDTRPPPHRLDSPDYTAARAAKKRRKSSITAAPVDSHQSDVIGTVTSGRTTKRDDVTRMSVDAISSPPASFAAPIVPSTKSMSATATAPPPGVVGVPLYQPPPPPAFAYAIPAPADPHAEDIINCICDTPYYDDTLFMISCDRCKQWFHGRCVNIAPGSDPESWFCPRCRRKKRP